MTKDAPSGNSKGASYDVSARLLARKGSAGPLMAQGRGEILSRDAVADASDEARLAEDIVGATRDLLSGSAGPGRSPKATARLTDLFDPGLTDGKRQPR